MILLDFFRKRCRLVAELNQCRNKLALNKIVVKQPDRCYFYIDENQYYFDVNRKFKLNEGGQVDVIIKRFPKGDDAEYARLCANELLDKLNEEV